MGTFIDRVWPGNPTGGTRAERMPCRYRAYLPEPLRELELTLPARMAADLADTGISAPARPVPARS